MIANSSLPPTHGNCLGQVQLDELLVKQRLESSSASNLADHLLSPCERCWHTVATVFHRAGWADDGSFPASGDALLRAIWTAALAHEKPPTEKHRLLRSVHRRDAELARGSRHAFLRLILHEALVAALLSRREPNTSAIDGAWIWVAGHASRMRLQPRDKADLEAWALMFRAYIAVQRNDFEAADDYLLLAHQNIEQGTQDDEPLLSWHELRAVWHRKRNDEDDLHAARQVLRNALQRLGVEANDERRAELMHDLGQVHLALGELRTARSDFKRADELLELPHGPEGSLVSPVLRSAVVLAWARAEILIATDQSLAERQFTQRLVRVLFEKARRYGGADDGQLEYEAQRLADLLEDAC